MADDERRRECSRELAWAPRRTPDGRWQMVRADRAARAHLAFMPFDLTGWPRLPVAVAMSTERAVVWVDDLVEGRGALVAWGVPDSAIPAEVGVADLDLAVEQLWVLSIKNSGLGGCCRPAYTMAFGTYGRGRGCLAATVHAVADGVTAVIPDLPSVAVGTTVARTWAELLTITRDDPGTPLVAAGAVATSTARHLLWATADGCPVGWESGWSGRGQQRWLTAEGLLGKRWTQSPLLQLSRFATGPEPRVLAMVRSMAFAPGVQAL